VTADPYDGPLSALRGHVDDLGAWLAIWSARDDGRPDAHARRCANDAMDAIDAIDAIDAMLSGLHEVRARLVIDIRQADDAGAARADELLRGDQR